MEQESLSYFQRLWRLRGNGYPAKRDIRGRKYVFVVNVKDNRVLATKVVDIFIENMKFFANIPRF